MNHRGTDDAPTAGEQLADRPTAAAQVTDGNRLGGILVFTDEYIPGISFTFVGRLSNFESLLEPVADDVAGLATGDYRPHVIAYRFPSGPRYSIVFLPVGISVPTDQQYRFLPAAASFLSGRYGLLEVEAAPLGDGETPIPADGQRGPATEYRLDVLTTEWRGREPESIAGTANPTLPLLPGRQYQVTFTNVDGLLHQFVIADGNGEVLVASRLSSDESETVSVSFTATRDMARYYCGVHENRAAGDIRIVDNA